MHARTAIEQATVERPPRPSMGVRPSSSRRRGGAGPVVSKHSPARPSPDSTALALASPLHRTASALEKEVQLKAREKAESLVATSQPPGPGSGAPDESSFRTGETDSRRSWRFTERFWSTSSRRSRAGTDSSATGQQQQGSSGKSGKMGGIVEHAHRNSVNGDAMLGFWDKKDEFFVSDDKTRKLARQVARSMWNQAMEKSDLMRNTPVELRDALFDQAIPIFVSAGDVLFEMGGYGQMFFVLCEGRLKRDFDDYGGAAQDDSGGGKARHTRHTHHHRSGHDKSGYLKPGVALAENCVLVNQPHKYSCTVKDDSVLLAVHRLQYQHLTLAVGEAQSGSRSYVGGGFASGIHEVPLLALLKPHELEALDKVLKEVTFKPGQLIARATDPCPGLYLVKSGQVAMRVPKLVKSQAAPGAAAHASSTSSVNADDVNWLKHGDFFGDGTLFTDSGQLGINVFCSYDGPTTLLLLRREDFKSVVADMSRMQHAHLSLLFNRLPLFAHLEAGEINRLVEATVLGDDLRTFPPHSVIARPGDSCADGFYVVARGTVKVTPVHALAAVAAAAAAAPPPPADPNIIQPTLLASSTPPSPRGDATAAAPPTAMAKDQRRKLLLNHLMEGSKRSMVAMAAREHSSSQHQPHSNADLSNNTATAPRGGGGTGLDVAPKLGMSAALGMSLHLLKDDVLGAGGDLSQSHDALFGSAAENEFAVLFSGETFAESSLRDSKDEASSGMLDMMEAHHYRAEIRAMGEVVCAFVPLERLGKMDLLSRVRQAYYEEEDGIQPSQHAGGGGGTSEGEDILTLAAAGHHHVHSHHPQEASVLAAGDGDESGKRISTSLLRTAKIKATEESAHQASSKSLLKTTSAFTMTTKRLIKVETLHATDLVDVYVAVHAPSKQLCVVKSLNVAVANQQGMGAYVLSEQLVLGELSSPFVTSMIAAWMEPERFLMTLEPALGGDLESALRDTMKGVKDSVPRGELGGCSYEFVRFVGACMILALKHCYEHGVIHRDLKPANIIMDHHGYCQLVDFGIAKRLSGSTMRTSTLLGSPKYMCPELTARARGSGDSYTNACDWWALGASLYHLLVGYTPFEGKLEGGSGDFPEIFSRVDRYARDLTSQVTGKPPSERLTLIKNHFIFSPFTNQAWPTAGGEAYKWGLMQNFIAKLLDPVASMRLGSAPRGGPRQAMQDPLYKVSDGGATGEEAFALDWNKLAHRTLRAPFVPHKLILDLKALPQQTEQAIKLAAGGGGAPAGVDSPPPHRSNAPPGRGKLPHLDSQRRKLLAMQANDMAVESVVRSKLEALDGPMDHIVSSAQGARQRMVLAREQHLKKMAFRQGMSLDTLERSASSTVSASLPVKRTLGLIIIQRAAVLDFLHQASVAGGGAWATEGGGGRLARSLAAIRIQRVYRGYRGRVSRKSLVEKELERLAAAGGGGG